ncbi:MAG TPA: exodeoxyribonuclease VII large subunit [Tepidisphaeraceae bacterium]|jgi:exodeoxyribonuclease VII large subunit|nr:exodeoxyribonuclease VII large subunit [Tepidisphaeraceae bacterium]
MPESFFEFRSRVIAPKPEPAPAKGVAPISVSELTARLELAVANGLPSVLLLQGQVSNARPTAASGHVYFTLKDASNCIDCVMFRRDAERVKFQLADGLELIATGKVGIYGQRGKYQFYVTKLEPIGKGALELAFRQLCARLEAEGLFAAERKKPIPRYPRRLLLITSQEAAALQDMLKVLRRFPFLHLSLFHVPVQGEGAAEKIAAAIDAWGKATGPHRPDAMLLARGGGSLEDLWAFNEEVVARAIFRSTVPIITGIGHEVDTSVADLVADYHAHTPTEAAQVATHHWRTAGDRLDTLGLRFRRALAAVGQEARTRLAAIERHPLFRRPAERIDRLRQLLDDRQRALDLAASRRLGAAAAIISAKSARLDRQVPAGIARYTRRIADLEARLRERHPRHRLHLQRQHLDVLQARLNNALKHSLSRQSESLTAIARSLEAVNPNAVLRRGYTLTYSKKDQKLLRSAAEVRPGEKLLTRFSDGQVESAARGQYEDRDQLSLFGSTPTDGSAT